jgi:hypothetical protein
VYRASISRIVGLVVAPYEAASARGRDAREFRDAMLRNGATPSAPVPGSMIPPVERRGGPSSTMQPVHSPTRGKLARAVRRTPAFVVVSAGATPIGRIRKVE